MPRKESLSYRIFHTVSHLSDIRLNFQLYLTSYVSFYLVCGSLIAKGTFQLHFDSIIEYTLTFTVSGTNLSRTFTNVSKILSAINANILNINTYLIEKGYTSTW